MKKLFLEMFCSLISALEKRKNPSILRPKEENFIDAVENTFLSKVDTYLKLPLQKIF